jgi:hypothetical protein
LAKKSKGNQALQAKMLVLEIPPTGEFPQTGGD